jgi:beta-glucanase (GH16 family)
MRRILAIMSLLAGALVLAAPMPAGAAAPPDIPVSDPANYTMVFDDEFNGSAVDTGTWNYRTDAKALSAQKAANVSESGGSLNIALRKEDTTVEGTTYHYSGGGLVSRNSLRYGYYETRAKTPIGAGWHTSFWAMYGTGSPAFPPNLQRTEIDQFEINSSAPQTISQGIIGWHSDGSTTSIGRANAPTTFDSSAGWHVYGFNWTESQVQLYIDGSLVRSISYPPSTDTHDYLNVWLTSIGYEAVDDSRLPATAQFDYLRYYQRDYYVDNDTPASYGYTETGTWQDSSLPGFTVGTTSRYSTGAGATARWQPTLHAAGTYQVYLYKIVNPGGDPNATAAVAVAGGGGASTALNFSSGSTGWLSLGTFAFPSGSGNSVTLTAGADYARADAVKFVRVS